MEEKINEELQKRERKFVIAEVNLSQSQMELGLGYVYEATQCSPFYFYAIPLIPHVIKHLT